MPFFELDKNLCKKDSICAMLCPAAIIKLDSERYPYIESGDEEKCIKCGQCGSFCPYGACAVCSVDTSTNVDFDLLPSGHQAEMLIKSRRSIRMFRKDELSRDKIEGLLKIAESAPTAANSRLLRWTVVENKENLRKVADLVIEFFRNEIERLTELMPQYATFLEKMIQAYDSGKDVVFRGAPQLIIVSAPATYDWKMEDGVAALSYLELAAHGYGVGMCWAGYFIMAVRNYMPLRTHLGIAEDEHVCGAQMTGYPVLGTAKKVPDKKPYKVSYV